MVRDQHRGIAVRVINTTPEPQELRRGTCLGSLEAVEVCKQSQECDSSVSQDKQCVDSTSSEVDRVCEML